MDAIGKNTARAKDLIERADFIAGKERSLADLKMQAKELNDEIKDAYKAAASNGYSAPVLRKVMKELHLDPGEREAHYQEEMMFGEEVDVYRHALGLIADDGTPAANNDVETTISINGGPQVPLSVANKAVDIIKARHRRETAEADA